MRPLGDRVLIRILPPAEQIGSIIIPLTARTSPQEGRVEAIGSKVSTLVVGDQVLVGKWNTVKVPGSSDLMLIWERDVMAVLG